LSNRFFPKIVDNMRLALVEPAGENGEDEVEGLQNHRGIVGEVSSFSSVTTDPDA
jgi:hypothetical protein